MDAETARFVLSDRTLIRGGCVLTLGERTPNFTQADVLLTDGRIEEIGPRLRAGGGRVVDADDAIVMPGFVDCHRHTARSLLRNIGGPNGPRAPVASIEDWSPEDVYAATYVGLLGAAEAGVTTVADWRDGPPGAAHRQAVVEAHADSGLRTVLVDTEPGADFAAEERMSFAFASPDVTGSPENVPEILVRAWDEARSRGLGIHAHAGLSDDDRGSIEHLAGRGLLGSDVTLIHCSRLGPGDIEAAAQAGANVVLTPSTEMAGGLGAPPIQDLIDASARPGLGVDDERFAPGDLFAQMRATISVQHAVRFDLKLAGKAGLPKLLTTRDVIKYATHDGATALGLGSITGSIEVGKAADLIVLRTDRPNIHPVNDAIGAVVWGMDTSNLDWVFVGGTPLMQDGALVADVTTARSLATEALARITGRPEPVVERQGSVTT